MRLYLLKKRILTFRNKPGEFLMGITSNVLDEPRNAFLDVQGRIIAVCDQIRIASDEIWMAAEEPFLDRLRNHLSKYLAFSETVVEEMRDVRVFYDLDDGHPLRTGEMRIPQKKGSLILTREDYPTTVDEESYRLFRLEHAQPVQGIDYDREMLLNLGDEALVSYSKGCFLGQEIVARVHHRGRPPKRLVVREIPPGAPLPGNLTSVAADPRSGRRRGFCFVPNEEP